MAATPSFRRAADRDAQALATLAEKTFRDTYTRFNTPENMDSHCAKSFGEQLQLKEIRDAGRESWITEIDGVMVAFAQLIPDKPCPSAPAKRGVEILRFYVDAAQHGTGLAYRFMDELVARAAVVGGDVLWLCVWNGNARAAAFYKKCQFESIGTTTFQLGSETQHDWVMCRDLTTRDRK